MKMNKVYILNFNKDDLIELGYKIEKDFMFVTNHKDKLVSDISIDDITDKTYIKDPSIKIPKVKLDGLNKKVNFKKVRSNAKADYYITSIKAFHKMIKVRYPQGMMKIADLLAALKKHPEALLSEQITNLKLLDENDFIVCFHSSYNHVLQEYFKRENFRYIPVNDYDNYFKLINNANQIVLTDDIIKIIAQTQEELDDSSFDSLINMIKSSSKEDVSLALEVLANSNYKAKADFVSFFLYFYKQQLIIKANNYNNVNVKTMRDYFDKPHVNGNNIQHVGYYNNFIMHHANNNDLSEFIFNKVKELFINDFLKKVVNIGTMTHPCFEINSDMLLPGKELKFK